MATLQDQYGNQSDVLRLCDPTLHPLNQLSVERLTQARDDSGDKDLWTAELNLALKNLMVNDCNARDMN